jgi:hemerythrin
MAESGFVKWQNSYSVGIPLIDEQHKELIRLTNLLYESCMQGRASSSATFLTTVRGAVEYIGYHFSTEEKVMTRVNYPGYKAHKQQHTDFVKEVLHEVDNFTNGKPFSPNNFVHYLKDWVLTHIAVTDRKLGDYILDLKRKGALTNMTIKVKKDEEKKIRIR